MVSGGKPGEAAADNDDVGLMAALEGIVYLLVFEVGRLEPEIVEEVFVQLRRLRRIVAELFKAVGERPCAGRAGGNAAHECASGHFLRAARLRTAETSAHRTFLPYWFSPRGSARVRIVGVGRRRRRARMSADESARGRAWRATAYARWCNSPCVARSRSRGTSRRARPSCDRAELWRR